MNHKNFSYLIILSFTLALLSCKENNDVIYENQYYRLTLSKQNGAIESCERIGFAELAGSVPRSSTSGLASAIKISNKRIEDSSELSSEELQSIEKNGRNMIAPVNAEMPLFEICFRDTANSGKVVRTHSARAKQCDINQSKNNITISNDGFDGIDLSATVTVEVSKNSPLMHWNITVDNRTSFLMDYIDFPNVVVSNNLVGAGGDSRIFWPAKEGVVIEDLRIREGGIRKYRPIEYPNLPGWIGIYPSSAQTQFMAYYSPESGLYMASHDENFNAKGIEFHQADDNGIKLDYHLFNTGAGKAFLVTGRMIKPISFEGAGNIPMVSQSNGLPINFPSVFASNWQSLDHRNAKFFVNYLPETQRITLDAGGLKNVRISGDAADNTGIEMTEGTVEIEIDPSSAVMVRYQI